MDTHSPVAVSTRRRLTRVATLACALSLSLACEHQTNERPKAVLADAGADDEPAAAVDLADADPAYLFDPLVLRTFELRLREEDLAFLDADPKAEQYVPGELWFEDQRVEEVGIRYKGSTGSFVGCLSGGFFPPSGSKACPKLGMKIKIDYADPEAGFYGQKKLLFHAMNGDRSLMRERLGYGLYRELDVHASRTVHVRLLINGQLAGLFLLVEEVDGRFTRSVFADGGQGNLYKEVWPTDDDEARYLAALESNRDEHARADKIVAFARALAAADDDALPGVLESFMDTSYAARFVAVDRTIRHDDGPYHWYCQPLRTDGSAAWHRQQRVGEFNCGNHNYYWYEDSTADRLWPVPWDLDNAFPNRVGLTTIQSAWDDLSYDCTKLLPSPFGNQLPATCDPLQRAWALALRAPVKEAMRALVAGPLSEESTEQKLALWSEQVAPVVEEAAALFPRELSTSAWQAELAALKATLVRLRAEATSGAP